MKQRPITHCELYLTQRQAARLLRLLDAQPQKYWAPLSAGLRAEIAAAKAADARSFATASEGT